MTGLTRGDADSLVDKTGQKAVNGSLTWSQKPARVEGRIAIDCPYTSKLTLLVGVQLEKPWQWTVAITHGDGENIRRLDLRANHRNSATDKRRFVRQSHLHVWRGGPVLDQHAIDVEFQFWDDDTVIVPCGEYHAVVTAFCEHHGIDATGLVWTLPESVDCTDDAEDDEQEAV